MDNQVRWLAGYFDVVPTQLATLLRSCGANGHQPLLQPFKISAGGNLKFVTHPHYIVIFGPAQQVLCPKEQQPELPSWLKERPISTMCTLEVV